MKRANFGQLLMRWKKKMNNDGANGALIVKYIGLYDEFILDSQSRKTTVQRLVDTLTGQDSRNSHLCRQHQRIRLASFSLYTSHPLSLRSRRNNAACAIQWFLLRLPL